MKTAFILFALLLLLASEFARAQQTIPSLIAKEFQVTSTTKGSHPCPSMSDAQMLAIASPNNGDCVHNTTLSTWLVYNSSEMAWEEVGGGGLTAWVTATDYEIGDVVTESNKAYIAQTDHTSGTFATDVSNGDFQLLGATVDLSTDATGVLPMANGGTDKNLTPTLGGVIYTDAGSMEVLSPGTSGQILQTNGASAPTWVNKSISGKSGSAGSVTVEEIQTKDNHLTQTDSNKYLIETSNKNILSNPSFEHSTVDSGWTNNGTEVGVVDSTNFIDGLKSIQFSPSSETINLVQSSTLYQSQLADGVQCYAFVSIKSNLSAGTLSVCSVQAGTVSTTNCVNVNNDNRWNDYEVPFICGATSNGISIAGSGLTGTVKIDGAKVDFGRTPSVVNNIGPWISCTVTGSWVANTSYTCKKRQVGENYEYDVYVSTSGAPTAATLSINLPSGDVIDTTKMSAANAIGSTYLSSVFINDSGSQFYNGLNVTPNSSTSVVLRTANVSATYPTASGISNTIPITFGAGDFVHAIFTLPIVGLSGSSSIYSASCGANCVDYFHAKISSAGAVSDENVDFLNGNGSISDTSLTTFTFNNGIFTVAPNCFVTSAYNNAGTATIMPYTPIPSTTSSGFTVRQLRTSDFAKSNQETNILCFKTGVDFKASRSIVGSFKEVPTTPGINKIKTCYYAFGGASATLAAPTECTTGTCVEVLDSCGTGAPPSYNATADYRDLTFSSGTWANSSLVSCKCSAWDTTTGTLKECTPYFATSDNSWSSNSSGGYVVSMVTYSQAGTASDGYIQLECDGVAP